jgi:hypothetical protein
MCLSHFTSTYQLFTHSSTQQIVLSLGMITLCGKNILLTTLLFAVLTSSLVTARSELNFISLRNRSNMELNNHPIFVEFMCAIHCILVGVAT